MSRLLRPTKSLSLPLQTKSLLSILSNSHSHPLHCRGCQRCHRMMTTEAAAAEAEGNEEEKNKLKKINKLTDPGSHRDMRRAFYIDAVVDKIMNKSLGHPFLMWTKTRAEWYRLLKTEPGCRLLLTSRFLNQLRSSIQDDELEAMKKFGAEKVCLGRSFDEHNRMKRDLYHFKYLSLRNNAVRPQSTSPRSAGMSFLANDGSRSSFEERKDNPSQEFQMKETGPDAKDWNSEADDTLSPREQE